MCVCGGGGGVTALARLTKCVAASKRWRLIDCTICTRHLMGQPMFFYKAAMLLLKSCTFKLYLSQHMRVWFLCHMRTVVL